MVKQELGAAIRHTLVMKAVIFYLSALRAEELQNVSSRLV